MKLSGTHAFVNQFLVGLLVTIGFGGSVGLGTVWMRHQISVVADTNRELEQECHELERRADDIRAQVESALSPDVLRLQNETMGLGLVAMTQAQITPVPVDPIARLVARANRRVFQREAAANGIAIAFNLPTPTSSTAPLGDQPVSAIVHPVVSAPAVKSRPTRIQFATYP